MAIPSFNGLYIYIYIHCGGAWNWPSPASMDYIYIYIYIYIGSVVWCGVVDALVQAAQEARPRHRTAGRLEHHHDGQDEPQH